MKHLSQPSSRCLTTSSAIKGISQEQSHQDSGKDHHIVPWVPAETWTTPMQPAGQLGFGCFGSPVPSSPNLLALTAFVMWPQLAMPEEGWWIDCYQSSRQPSLGWAARLLLLEPEVLISRLQRPAYMIYLEVAFLSADVVLVQPDCLVKQPQEWILFASVRRGECKIFTSQESKTPSSLTNIN